MVMLLSIIVDPEHEEVGNWRGCVEKALGLFDGVASWPLAAERSKVVVGAIYEACGEGRKESHGEELLDGSYVGGFGVDDY